MILYIELAFAAILTIILGFMFHWMFSVMPAHEVCLQHGFPEVKWGAKKAFCVGYDQYFRTIVVPLDQVKKNG